MTISLLNPLENPDWDDLLPTSEQATFFHTSAWARVLSESYCYKPLYFCIIEGGRLTGLIPVMEIDSFLTGKRGVSLPFTDFCPPIAESLEAFNNLLETAIAHGRRLGWKYLELRGGSSFLANQPDFARHFTHTLELNPDEIQIQKLFKSNTMRNIRKAEKKGVSARIENSQEAMAAYYRLHCGTRRHHGLPPQPWAFFERIYKSVIAAGKGFVVLAAHAGKAIAGAVYFSFNDQAIYKFGASDRGSQHLRPNNLVMWEAIRWACRSGIRSFHFGRTEMENEGLAQFKRSWGTTEATIRYLKYNFRAKSFVADPASPIHLNGIFKHIPIPILRMAGSLLYRHVG